MTKSERQLAVKILNDIVEALEEGAAGPCHYWYLKLAERLRNRAIKILHDVDERGDLRVSHQRCLL